MKSDSLKGKTLGVISTMLTLVVSLITCVMYIVTSYYLYYFLAVTSLFLGVTNLLFMALEFDDMLSKLPKREKKKKKKKAKRAKHKQEEEEHPVETVTEEKVHKKHRINIHLIAKTICFAGLAIGKKAGTKLAGKAGIFGGAILIFIGLEIFITSFF